MWHMNTVLVGVPAILAATSGKLVVVMGGTHAAGQRNAAAYGRSIHFTTGACRLWASFMSGRCGRDACEAIGCCLSTAQLPSSTQPHYLAPMVLQQLATVGS